jgi:hypothetical protein
LAHISVAVEYPWEKQVKQSSRSDLIAHPSNSIEPTSGVQIDSASQATGSNDKSDHGDLLLTTELAMGSEAPVDDDATSPKQ